ncbi:helix-turn-helix domain-containing protein [Pseudarthrobacter sp. BRE9]|uniref:IclR family transcriptional regulator n=1 Tax=Pseudarthrobacter sp. BRE9 TaxID=2962582 RepID=UPI00288142B2|nr:helix-turn-helix domain-containing protein [Pseudarthrobacter sp. BRE9]MDT0169256.1 helix-turn-helix domain-containing protein [Pseudarthrobacter sp. BRE9]
MANSSTGESVIARIARILEAFDDEHPSLSLTSLAGRAGLPLSTAQRLVADLLTNRFLEKDAKGCLRIGLLILNAGGSNAPADMFLRLRNAAVPLMESVHAVLKQQITLAVLDKDEVLYLERVSPGSTAVNVTQKFARLPVLKTPSGLVLLAHHPVSFQDKVLASASDPEGLRATLAGARREGYVTRPSIMTKASIAVSVPVVGDGAGLPAALTAVIPRADAQINLTVAVLRAASFAISKALAADQPYGLESRRL